MLAYDIACPDDSNSRANDQLIVRAWMATWALRMANLGWNNDAISALKLPEILQEWYLEAIM